MSTESAPIQSSPVAANPIQSSPISAKPAVAKKARQHRPKPKAKAANDESQASPQNAASPTTQTPVQQSPSATQSSPKQNGQSVATSASQPSPKSKQNAPPAQKQNGHSAPSSQKPNQQSSPSTSQDNNQQTDNQQANNEQVDKQTNGKPHSKPRGKSAKSKLAKATPAPGDNQPQQPAVNGSAAVAVKPLDPTPSSAPTPINSASSDPQASPAVEPAADKKRNRLRRKKKLVAPASQIVQPVPSQSTTSNATPNANNNNSDASQRTQLRKPVFVKIADLEPATHGHNLNVKVIDVKVVFDKPRADGSRFIVNEALVADSTGCILLTMRNEQCNGVTAGSSIIVRNAKIEMFKGHMRLAVDVWGLIEPSSQPLTEQLNVDNNVSLTEYELVDA